MTDPAAPEDKNKDVSEYLVAPQKKRKNYVITALGPGFNIDLAAELQSHLKTTYPQHALATPKTEKDLQKQHGRNISLVILDDEFLEEGGVYQAVEVLKRRRQGQVTPVLFLTRDSKGLVERYHQQLAAFQESDDYVNYMEVSAAQIFFKIKTGIESQLKRRSRRFKTAIPVKFQRIGDSKWSDGVLEDLSLHGGALRDANGGLFRTAEQLRLHINITAFFHSSDGEFIRLSSRIRRVFIGGSICGLSWEHVTDEQLLRLTQFVTAHANQQVQRKSSTPSATKANTPNA